MTWSVDDFLDDFQAPSIEARICPRADLLERHKEAERRLVESGQSSGSLAGEAAELAQRVRDLEDEIDASTRTIKFRALSRRRWRTLLAEHHPLKVHKADGLDFNPETFPVAAIAACAVEPSLTQEQAERLADALPLGEFEKLWQSVLSVNLGVTDTPKSVLATAILRTNNGSSTTAAPGASPAASS